MNKHVNKEMLKLLKSFTLFDDIRSRMFFDEQPKLIKEMLSIILNKEIEVIEAYTQDDNSSLESRNAIFDVYVKDKSGKLYDIEVQNSMKDMPLKRARYYSSVLDRKLEKGEDFDKLPETYVIVIANEDPFKRKKPKYFFDRSIIVDNEVLDYTDQSHILYVNGTIKGKKDKLSMLMHDFSCNKSKDMYLKSFKERMRYQEQPKEQMKMCEKMDNYIKKENEKAINKTKVEMIKMMLFKGYDTGSISDIVQMSVDEILKIKETKLI